MKSQKGIALIASLLVMAVIMTVGIGSIGLSLMNSKITENTRSAAIAEANAEMSLNAAIITLNTYYKTSTDKKFPQSTASNKFPSSFLTPTIDGVAAFNANDYTYITNTAQTGYTLTVKGRTVSEGLHQSEALVAAQVSLPDLRGLVSEGKISVTGGGSLYTDAAIHGNKEFDLKNSEFYDCIERSADGTCVRKVELPAAKINATTAAAPIGKCSYSDISVCSGGIPQKTKPWQTVTPNYLGIRDAVIAASDVTKATPTRGGFTSSTNNIKCDKVYSSSSSLLDDLRTSVSYHRTMCVEGGTTTLPSNLKLTNTTIIAKGDISFTGEGTTGTLATGDKTPPSITNSTLISREGAVNLGQTVTIADSKIFSQGSLDLSGTQTNISGTSTIASAGNITIGGASKGYTSVNGNKGIGIAFIAEGDIEANGASEWYAEVRAGGKFTKSGSIKDMYGGIEAKGDIEVSGNVNLDTGLPILNTDILPLVPTTLSRR